MCVPSVLEEFSACVLIEVQGEVGIGKSAPTRCRQKGMQRWVDCLRFRLKVVEKFGASVLIEVPGEITKWFSFLVVSTIWPCRSSSVPFFFSRPAGFLLCASITGRWVYQ